MECAVPDTRLQQSRTTGGGVRRLSEGFPRKGGQTNVAYQGRRNDQDFLRVLLGRSRSICIPIEFRACLHESRNDPSLRSDAALRECKADYSGSTRKLEGRKCFPRWIRNEGGRARVLRSEERR